MLKHNRSNRILVALGILSSSALLAPAVSAYPIYGSPHNLGEQTILRYDVSGWVKIQPQQSGTLTWNCPSNAYVVGGGFETRPEPGNSAEGFTVIHSFPSSANGWQVMLRNQDDIARDVRIYRICAE
jgi:hypothetical protein